IPPVLHAYFGHGVVLEPHLQNVLVGVTADGMPVQMIFRDLEGVKLLPEQHSAILDELPPRVRAALSYSPEQGWKRVVYCLVVNHLAELAAAMNEVQPGIERRLWSVAREHFLECANYYDWPFQLRELLAGVPLPAKANLRTRFLQAADRDATYVSVANPLGDRSFSS
ncbi:MAG: IucA/IucC family C-terminal-domain containing protein, partial [Candidatus Dormibacteraceae bacterium]